MFDEVFDMFERDGRRSRPGGERRGLRGFISRLFDGDEDDEATRRGRYVDEDHDPDEGRPGHRRRDRDNDVFEFGD